MGKVSAQTACGFKGKRRLIALRYVFTCVTLNKIAFLGSQRKCTASPHGFFITKLNHLLNQYVFIILTVAWC